jgi:hypothetical protein
MDRIFYHSYELTLNPVKVIMFEWAECLIALFQKK